MCEKGQNNRRRSGRLFERWVTIETGRPLHKINIDAAKVHTVNKYKASLPSIPEDIIYEESDIGDDIVLPRHSSLNIFEFDNNSMATDPRVDTLETEVSSLKSDLGACNEKLDKLLQSMANLSVHNDDSPSRHQERPPAPQQQGNQATSATGYTSTNNSNYNSDNHQPIRVDTQAKVTIPMFTI